MDFKQIQELIKIVNRSNIGELSIEEGDFKILIKQKEDPSPVYAAAPVQSTYQAPPQQPSLSSAPNNVSLPEAQPVAAEKPADNLIIIKSPMIGTFYRSAGPNKPAFINIGDE